MRSTLEQQGLLLKTVGIVLLPVPAVATHLLDAELCLPSELLLGLGGIAVAGGDVARTARLDGVGHVDTVDLDESLHHIDDGGTWGTNCAGSDKKNGASYLLSACNGVASNLPESYRKRFGKSGIGHRLPPRTAK